MNILIDIRLLAKGKVAGIEEYTRELLPRLFRSNQNDHFTFFYNGFRRASLPLEWRTEPNVRVVEWGIPNKAFDFSERFLMWPASSAIARSDVLFTPHFNLLRATPGTRRVMTFHDLSFVHYPEFFPPRKHHWHWMQDYAREGRKAEAIITNSEFTAEDLHATLGIQRERIHVVYPGVNPRYRKLADDDAMLTKFRAVHPELGRFILSVGVLEPRKNIVGLIQSFELLKTRSVNRDLKLVIVGERGWLYRTIFSRLRRSPVAGDIIMWGHASSDDTVCLYNLAHVFAYPSFFEGFGFPPLEAQACGVPVVVSSRSSLPEIIGDSGLLVNPWNTGETADAIGAFLGSTELRRHYQARGFENQKRFSWDSAAEGVARVFTSVMR